MLEIARTIFIIIGIIGIGFLIWLIIEAALTVRRARKLVAGVHDQIQPTLDHVEKITNDIQPAVEKIDPLLERAQLTVDSVNLELMQVDKILGDASNVTGKVSSATQKVSDVTGAPSKFMKGIANRLRDTAAKDTEERKIEAAVDGATKSIESGQADSEVTEPVAETSKIAEDWAKAAKGASEEPADAAEAAAQEAADSSED